MFFDAIFPLPSANALKKDVPRDPILKVPQTEPPFARAVSLRQPKSGFFPLGDKAGLNRGSRQCQRGLATTSAKFDDMTAHNVAALRRPQAPLGSMPSLLKLSCGPVLKRLTKPLETQSRL
jgi:hypothetical protein